MTCANTIRITLFSVMVSLAFAATAEAEEAVTDRLALSLKERGDQALAEQDFRVAIDAYDRANAIQHHPILDFNRARALQGLMRHAEALDALERFDREASSELRARVPGLTQMLTELRSHVGQVVFSGEDRAARLTINGRSLGKLQTGKPYRVDLGDVAIRVEASGFTPIEQTVTVTSDTEPAVELVWKRLDLRGRVLFKANVAAAELRIDGERRGQTPIEIALTPGRHRVQLTHSNSKPFTTEIDVAPKERRELTLVMQPRPPLLARWWFWTAVGVVAASAVTTGIILNTKKDPTPGDIAPGIVSAPLMMRF